MTTSAKSTTLANGERTELPNGNGDEGDKTLSGIAVNSNHGFDEELLKAQIEDHAIDVKKFSDIEKTTQNEGVGAPPPKHSDIAATRETRQSSKVEPLMSEPSAELSWHRVGDSYRDI